MMLALLSLSRANQVVAVLVALGLAAGVFGYLKAQYDRGVIEGAALDVRELEDAIRDADDALRNPDRAGADRLLAGDAIRFAGADTGAGAVERGEGGARASGAGGEVPAAGGSVDGGALPSQRRIDLLADAEQLRASASEWGPIARGLSIVTLIGLALFLWRRRYGGGRSVQPGAGNWGVEVAGRSGRGMDRGEGPRERRAFRLGQIAGWILERMGHESRLDGVGDGRRLRALVFGGVARGGGLLVVYAGFASLILIVSAVGGAMALAWNDARIKRVECVEVVDARPVGLVDGLGWVARFTVLKLEEDCAVDLPLVAVTPDGEVPVRFKLDVGTRDAGKFEIEGWIDPPHTAGKIAFLVRHYWRPTRRSLLGSFDFAPGAVEPQPDLGAAAP